MGLLTPKRGALCDVVKNAPAPQEGGMPTEQIDLIIDRAGMLAGRIPPMGSHYSTVEHTNGLAIA